MKDDLSYIDNITGEKLKNFILEPKVNWEVFNKKLNAITSNSGFFSNIGGFFSTKTIVVTGVVILSILTAGIIITGNNADNLIIKGDSLFMKDQTEKQSEEIYPIQGKNDTTNLTNEDSVSDIEDNVVIKIEIPVHKQVIIKKEVILKDTINVKDSVNNK